MINRAQRNRFKLKSVATSEALRFSVFKSLKHVYAQIFDNTGGVIASSSTNAKQCPVYLKPKMEKAAWVGKEIAQKILSNSNFINGKKIYFDRGKYAYHGVVQKIAEAARAEGLEF